MDNLKQAQHAFDKCKINFLSINGSPFLATILFGMKHRFSTEVKTLATSGLELIINPDFFLSIPDKQREAELAHECWHVALSHIPRLYDRNQKKWNYATDYAINIMMHDSHKYQLGDDWLLDEKYRGMTADIIYNLLPDIDDEDGPDHMYKPSGDNGQPLPQSVVASEIQQLVSKAATVAQQKGEQFGYTPGGLEFLLEPILKPKLNWKNILLNYVSTLARNDYSYRRLNRRYFPDYYMPTLYSEAVGEIAVAFDASCSVSDYDFRLMLGQLKQINTMLQPELTRLVTFDTEIQNEYRLNGRSNLKSLKFNGRGGTDVHCVFEHFKKINPKVLILFSDMEFRMPTEKPAYPVIWIGVKPYDKNIKVPFGKYIEYTE